MRVCSSGRARFDITAISSNCPEDGSARIVNEHAKPPARSEDRVGAAKVPGEVHADRLAGRERALRLESRGLPVRGEAPETPRGSARAAEDAEGLRRQGRWVQGAVEGHGDGGVPGREGVPGG